jgi:hypothetical protein
LRTGLLGLQLCLTGSLAGCGGETAARPQLVPEQRQAVKDNLLQLRAKVTSETPEALFVSLRNTHIEIREFGGVVDGMRRTSGDVEDFGLICEAIAKAFLESAELEAFKQLLRQSLASNASTPVRAEYQRLTASLTQSPLRFSFSVRQTTADQ